MVSSAVDPRKLWSGLKSFVPADWETAEKGSLALPGTPVKMKMSLRPSPEYPPEVWPDLDEAEPVGPGQEPATTEPALEPATTEPAGEAEAGENELEQ